MKLWFKNVRESKMGIKYKDMENFTCRYDEKNTKECTSSRHNLSQEGNTKQIERINSD